ncbi:MAG TPA: hypothetical protein VKB51_19860 [bacterium]|nr:hypothetical protein [bacterium]
MKRLATLGVLVAFALVLGSLQAGATPSGIKHGHKDDSHGVVSVLNDILQELQMISAQIATGGGGSSDDAIKQPTHAEGLVAPPVPGENVLVSLTGPGKFLSARLSKQGGDSGLTEVKLTIDGHTVVARNIVALQNLGLTANNPYGIVVSGGSGIDTVTIGFQEPLAFESSLTLSANVQELGVVQITGVVVYGH